jgi:hypothetical protein
MSVEGEWGKVVTVNSKGGRKRKEMWKTIIEGRKGKKVNKRGVSSCDPIKAW